MVKSLEFVVLGIADFLDGIEPHSRHSTRKPKSFLDNSICYSFSSMFYPKPFVFPKPKITFYKINIDQSDMKKFNLSLLNESKVSQRNLKPSNESIISDTTEKFNLSLLNESKDSQQNLNLPFDQEIIIRDNTSSKKTIKLYNKDDGIYLNDLKLFSFKSHHKDMPKQLAILKILIDHYNYKTIHGSCFLSTSDICSRLEHEFGFYISNDQFFLLIHRLRSRCRLPLNDFISSESRKGYRLNDDVILIRSDDMKGKSSGEMKCKTFEMKGTPSLTHCFSTKFNPKVKGKNS